jgi:DNA-binding transcriptional LysR family regulator
MVLPEIRLLQAAIALAEELNFSRAAARLRIDAEQADCRA